MLHWHWDYIDTGITLIQRCYIDTRMLHWHRDYIDTGITLILGCYIETMMLHWHWDYIDTRMLHWHWDYMDTGIKLILGCCIDTGITLTLWCSIVMYINDNYYLIFTKHLMMLLHTCLNCLFHAVYTLSIFHDITHDTLVLFPEYKMLYGIKSRDQALFMSGAGGE